MKTEGRNSGASLRYCSNACARLILAQVLGIALMHAQDLY